MAVLLRDASDSGRISRRRSYGQGMGFPLHAARQPARTPAPFMTLVDTSVWIELFRKTRPLDLTARVPIDEVVTCLPVIQEVLQGFREEAAYRLARDAMLAL